MEADKHTSDGQILFNCRRKKGTV